MPWRPLPAGGVAFAICVHPFRATQAEDLPLQIGDNLYIIEQGGQNNEWCRGYLVAPPSLLSGLTSERGQHLEHRVFTGIFPRNCVEVREYIGENKANEETSTPRIGGFDGTNYEDEDPAEKRKSQALSARRLSKALVRKRSMPEVLKKDRPPLVDTTEPLPRDPSAPKPLAPVPMLRVGDETGQSVQEPLVDEIASCMREWHDARLHDMLLTREDVQFGPLTELTKRLDISRKQLLHDVMTTKELETLREDTVWDLVAGNKMMNDDVIVRCPNEKGRILTAADSVIEMTKHQANMSILDRQPKAPVDMNMHYHVLVDVRSIVGDFSEPATLHIYLCTKEYGEKPKAVSEMYAISLPLPDTPAEKAEDQPKTLFVDLSSSDIGIGSASTKKIYAVFKLIRDESIRQITTAQPSIGHQHKSSTTTLQAAAGVSQKIGSMKGRRSVFGSQRRNESRTRVAPEVGSRPATGQSQLSYALSSHSTERPGSRDTKTVKRTVGVGAINVGELVREQSEIATNVTLWTPAFSVDDDRSDETDDWSEIIREILRSANGGYSRVERVKRFEVLIATFASSDLEALYRNSPTQLYNVHMTQKIGFSGVPTQKRSDIYLTLTEPLVGRNAAFQHSKFGNIPILQRCQSSMANLQLTLEVRRENGERIENCIYTASNHEGHTAWRTTGIERGEAWNQTIKLVVPTEDVSGSHVVMSIADAPNFPFALAWIPLWESDAFVRDGDHQVALYVYDEYSSSIINGKGAYLGLPPWHDRKHEPVYGTSATISVRTFLCSTEYSQDPTLLGLVNWRNFHGTQLMELLERFSFVPEIEIVKLLADIIEALFEILHEYANSQIHEDIIFYNFVVIMGVARDRRFDLGCIMNYAPSVHNWPYASQCLLAAYQRLVLNHMDLGTARKLRETLKAGDQMLRLIVETKQETPDGSSPVINGEVNGDSGERHPEFEQDMQNLFVAIMALMRNPMPVQLGTQTLVVQHFHSWLPELAAFMTPGNLMEIATNLLDACAHAKGWMILYRLILILNYSHLDIFKPPEIRTTLIANTFRWLDPYWGETVDVTDQWHDQVRLCCSVVAAQMEELGDDSCQYVPKMVSSYMALQKVHRTPKKTYSMLFPAAYPFPFKTTPTEIDVDEAMVELSALLAAALTTQQRLYFDANQVDVPGVLLQALYVEQSVLSGEAFPKSWLSVYVSHHRFAITTLERLFEVLVDFLPDSNAPDMQDAIEFDTELWRAFFETLFMAVSNSALAMETFPEQKRRAVWKIAGDVREMGADLVRRSWNAIGWETEADSRELHGFERMGGYQVQFVPELIAPIVKLCLSVHASLRNVATEVLRTMIVSTWEIDQDLSVIQSAMVDCLDRLCRSKEVTETMLQTTFIDGMVSQFEPLKHSIEDSLYNAVVEMFKKIEELLGMLEKVHQISASNETTRIIDTLRLMEFFRDVHSEEAYIRYVHQLVKLQVAAGNHTEAGLALKMHAERYEWDPATQVGAIAEQNMPAQSAFERKETLYFEMCQHFERSQSWQSALVSYRELAQQYEHNIFDFSKLARSQRAMASIHERIAKGDRINARYFRVVYRGLGFSHSLRDKEFIFEGLPNDRLATFEDRVQQYHPTATILRSSTEPDVEGQYLHIYPLSAYKELNHMVYQRTKVSQAAREHTLLSNPQKFTFTSRQPQHDVPLTEQVVEKVIYTTAESFPTLLRRSEIVRAETVTLSPIQAAVERTTRKTQELLVLEKHLSGSEDEEAMSRLADELLLSVDPDSDSSVSRYRTLLPRSERGNRMSGEADYSMPEKEDEQMTPMQNALNAALLDHAVAIRRCLARFNGAVNIAAKAELVPRFEATFERELAILFPQKQDVVDDLPERASLHEADAPARATHAAELDAVAGAREETKNVHDDHQQEPEARRSRRRSIPFLRRVASSSSNRMLNGTGEDNENGRQSRQSTRSRSRQRGESLTRRLSWFRNEREGDIGVRSPSVASGREAKESGGVGGGLKKRLSFLRAAGRSGLTGSRDAY